MTIIYWTSSHIYTHLYTSCGILSIDFFPFFFFGFVIWNLFFFPSSKQNHLLSFPTSLLLHHYIYLHIASTLYTHILNASVWLGIHTYSPFELYVRLFCASKILIIGFSFCRNSINNWITGNWNAFYRYRSNAFAVDFASMNKYEKQIKATIMIT